MILRFYSRGGARRCWFGLHTHAQAVIDTVKGWGRRVGSAAGRGGGETHSSSPTLKHGNKHTLKDDQCDGKRVYFSTPGIWFLWSAEATSAPFSSNTEVEKLTSSSLLFKYHPARSDRTPLHSTPSPPLRYRDAHGDSEHKSKSVYRSLLIHLATQPVALDGCRCPISILQVSALVPHLWAVSRFRFARR